MVEAGKKGLTKRLLEVGIFQWMPFEQVSGLYYQVWPWLEQKCILGKWFYYIVVQSAIWAHYDMYMNHYSGPVGLTGGEWFHGRCRWIYAHCLHSHSGPVGLTVSEWFYGRCSWICSHCLHSHSGPVGLTASEWFDGMCSWVSSHCLHSHSGPVGLTGSEWLSWQKLSPFSLLLLSIWFCWLHSQ